MSTSNPRIAVIGGGTGSFTLLSELKNGTDNITALVNMVDDGGSTGVLRDQYGVLPPGDVRQCLVALSRSSESLRELFNYRFPDGTDFAGHSMGNLFLSGVELMRSDFGEAVKLASQVLNITGRVIPMTLDNCRLVLDGPGGRIVGEHKIAKANVRVQTANLSLEPEAVMHPEAKIALNEAELIVIAPGNLYSSLVPALLVKGVSDVLKQIDAPVVYVCNLVNKPLHTKGYMVHDYINELEILTGKGVISHVLYNTDLPDKKTMDAYALDGEYPVEIDDSKLQGRAIIAGSFLQHTPGKRNENDSFILRSLIRHDAKAITNALLGILT